MIAAETAGLTPFVRVPGGAPGRTPSGDDDGRVASGVDGARGSGPGAQRRASGVDGGAILRAARYAPEGIRSLNGGRGPGYGTLDLHEYLERANGEIMVIAMIEDAEGVEEIDAILAVPGLDMVLDGAADLSQSLGVAWQTRHARVTTALAHVAERCAAAGVPYCALPREPGDIAGRHAAGVRAFVLGEERSIAARALRAHREAHRA